MDTLLKIAAVALIASLFATLLKKTSPDMALLFVITVCVVFLALLTNGAQTLITDVQALVCTVGIDLTEFMPLVKTIAISIVSKTGAELCRDAGENAVGGLVELAGTLVALLCAMPLLSAVWDILSELL